MSKDDGPFRAQTVHLEPPRHLLVRDNTAVARPARQEEECISIITFL